ncbi:AraC family transcriptional regulator [Deltaproteobacteria bacterium]|nr:AraC family transcriptional regulator [Deltaproteobacteria bacterium]
MSNSRESKNLPVHTMDSFSEGDINFNISAFDQMCALSHSPFPHRHAFYEIMYIEGGEGTHIIDFEPYPVTPDSIFYFSPGQTHFWKLTRPLEGRSIRFTENFLLFSPSQQFLIEDLDFFHNLAYPPHILPGINKGEEIKHFFSQIETESRSNGYGRDLNIRSHLIILLIEIQRLFIAGINKKGVMKSSTIISLFKKMVSNEFLTRRSVGFYADKLGITEAYLYELSKQITGLTPGQIIRKEIALEAKRQLAHTDSTVAEIGYKLHFDDPSYFGRFFKRETGLSPRSFRSHIREKYQIL